MTAELAASTLKLNDKDEWLFGWDNTPGIVSVWADRTGRALVWQRVAGVVCCSEDHFRPWLLATTLADLAHLGAALSAVTDAGAASHNLPAFCYQELNAPSTARAFRYLISAQNGQELEREILRGAKKRLKQEFTHLRELYYDYYRVGPVEQYLMATGKVYFRGLSYSDLHRLQFDLETTALDPNQGRIFLVAVRDSKGLNTILEAPKPEQEAGLIQDLCQLIRECDPDIIENHNLLGFDLPFLEARAAVLRVPLHLSRQPAPLALERFQERQAYRRGKRTRYAIPGRELIDTLDAVRRHDFVTRDMPGHGLKAVARYFGVASEERVYLPGAKVYQTYLTEPELVRHYALDDVSEVDELSKRLMGASFALAGMAPRPYSRLASAGPAMGILEPMLVRAYLREGAALSSYPYENEALTGQHSGGATILYAAGVARQVVKVDVASMYPSIMRVYGISPRPDYLKVLLYLVNRLTDLRFSHKTAVRVALANSSEAYLHQAMQAAMKTLINSAYGYMGAVDMALYADRDAADAVTTKGRELLGQIAERLQQGGMALLEADTDGVFFAAPEGWTEAEERACVAEVAKTLPEGIRLEYEGRYQAMLSHEVKNYALLTYDGKLIMRGVAMRSSRAEPFADEFLQKAMVCTLRGDVVGLRQLYLDTVIRLRERKFSAGEVATIARITKSAGDYLRTRSKLREGAYEALLNSGRTNWGVGERVRFYRAVNGNYVWLPEEEAEAELAQERADAAPPVEFGGARGAEGRRLGGDTKPDYDVEHYLKVLNTSYLSRLRKAFAKADFEQLFRLEGQMGLFDKPIEELTPHWIVCQQ